MRVAGRRAVPVVLPRSGAAKPARERLLRLLANAVVVLSAAAAIVVVALTAVMMGII